MVLALVLAWLAAVAWNDWFRLRIPNTLVAAGAAFVAMAVAFGVHPRGLGVLEMLAGAGVVLAIGLVLFARRWVGAGDVKLLAVIGGWLGASEQLLIVWAVASVFALLHVVGWQALRAWRPGLALAPSDPGASARRRLPHGAHLALAAMPVIAFAS